MQSETIAFNNLEKLILKITERMLSGENCTINSHDEILNF